MMLQRAVTCVTRRGGPWLHQAPWRTLSSGVRVAFSSLPRSSTRALPATSTGDNLDPPPGPWNEQRLHSEMQRLHNAYRVALLGDRQRLPRHVKQDFSDTFGRCLRSNPSLAVAKSFYAAYCEQVVNPAPVDEFALLEYYCRNGHHEEADQQLVALARAGASTSATLLSRAFHLLLRMHSSKTEQWTRIHTLVTKMQEMDIPLEAHILPFLVQAILKQGHVVEAYQFFTTLVGTLQGGASESMALPLLRALVGNNRWDDVADVLARISPLRMPLEPLKSQPIARSPLQRILPLIPKRIASSPSPADHDPPDTLRSRKYIQSVNTLTFIAVDLATDPDYDDDIVADCLELLLRYSQSVVLTFESQC
jgi:hypothetical protein